ncbi:MAG: UDP-N-acetylmuramate dehydrogenase [Candidatus Saccharibacteria bacterium]
MEPSHDTPLAPLTSLAVGGPAERLYTCATDEDLQAVLAEADGQQLWVLGYGANALISDAGLPGTTICIRTAQILRDGDTIVADAGVWWDDLVQHAIREQLWGLELMSAIPGGVGAAVVGNIAAYGQAVADTLAWVEVFDRTAGQTRRLVPDELELSYRYSRFQTDDFKDLVILRAAFNLRAEPTKEVTYQSALDIAREIGADVSTLAGRRQTILETRGRAGSLWDYHDPGTQMHTAGSFFRNPVVSQETAEKLMAYDETGKTAEMLQKMNRVHGGDQKRVSAAHVLLATGFVRGQTWGPVRLHPDHILKLENTGGATAQQIYDVAREIILTVKTKLDIELQPEVRFLGEFKD